METETSLFDDFIYFYEIQRHHFRMHSENGLKGHAFRMVLFTTSLSSIFRELERILQVNSTRKFYSILYQGFSMKINDTRKYTVFKKKKPEHLI